LDLELGEALAGDQLGTEIAIGRSRVSRNFLLERRAAC
jgi:hypothetical protein